MGCTHNKDQAVRLECPGYDVKLHPLRGAVARGQNNVTPYPHCTQVHFGLEWCNLLGPLFRELPGQQELKVLVWTPF